MNDVAWHIDNGEHAAVVFAENAESALRRGMAQLPSDCPEDLTASRAEQYDQYAASGEVPFSVLVSDGWIFTCDSCGGEIGPEDEEAVRVKRLTFCGQTCRAAMSVRVEEVNSAFEEFKERVSSRFPGLTFTEFHGGWPILTPIAKFKFPGALYGGGRVRQGQDGKLELSVAQGDLEAWGRWSASQASMVTHQPE